MEKISPILIFVFIFAAFGAAKAANQSDVLINEIAWMGSANSANDEWMELKNTTDKDINVSGWVLKSADEKLKINLKDSIPAKGFYLLERTDDNSVPNITADLIYKGSLGNGGEYLKLYDNANNIIDQADFAAKWPAGDNKTKQTMEKSAGAPFGSWQTSQNPNGTPKKENGPGTAEAINAPSAQTPHSKNTTNIPASDNLTPAAPISAQTPVVKQNMAPIIQNYPDGIIINEILPSPEGADEANEWIELYNTNNFDVNVSGWKLQDTKGITATYIFPKDANILKNGYVVLKRPETKIILNNDSDGLSLISPNEKITYSVFYENAPKNQSYNNVSSGWKWSTTLTPESANIIGALSGKAAKKQAKMLSKVNKTDKNKTNINVASVSDATNPVNKEVSERANPWLLFLSALAITIISAIIILILKLKVFKNPTPKI